MNYGKDTTGLERFTERVGRPPLSVELANVLRGITVHAYWSFVGDGAPYQVPREHLPWADDVLATIHTVFGSTEYMGRVYAREGRAPLPAFLEARYHAQLPPAHPRAVTDADVALASAQLEGRDPAMSPSDVELAVRQLDL